MTVSRLSLCPGSGLGLQKQTHRPRGNSGKTLPRDERSLAETPTKKKDGMLTFPAAS